MIVGGERGDLRSGHELVEHRIAGQSEDLGDQVLGRATLAQVGLLLGHHERGGDVVAGVGGPGQLDDPGQHGPTHGLVGEAFQPHEAVTPERGGLLVAEALGHGHRGEPIGPIG